MKTLAYKITFKSNTQAIISQEILRKNLDVSLDERKSNILYLPKDILDDNMVDMMDIDKDLEDISMVFEFDIQPDIEIVEYEFSENEKDN